MLSQMIKVAETTGSAALVLLFLILAVAFVA
jgi:hypothetical protein